MDDETDFDASHDSGGIEEIGPFDEQLVKQVQLIVLMRIYDVGMAILTNMNTDAAARLHALHEQGKIKGSWPVIDM